MCCMSSSTKLIISVHDCIPPHSLQELNWQEKAHKTLSPNNFESFSRVIQRRQHIIPCWDLERSRCSHYLYMTCIHPSISSSIPIESSTSMIQSPSILAEPYLLWPPALSAELRPTPNYSLSMLSAFLVSSDRSPPWTAVVAWVGVYGAMSHEAVPGGVAPRVAPRVCGS